MAPVKPPKCSVISSGKCLANVTSSLSHHEDFKVVLIARHEDFEFVVRRLVLRITKC
jgi:hypothetical protein